MRVSLSKDAHDKANEAESTPPDKKKMSDGAGGGGSNKKCNKKSNRADYYAYSCTGITLYNTKSIMLQDPRSLGPSHHSKKHNSRRSDENEAAMKAAREVMMQNQNHGAHPMCIGIQGPMKKVEVVSPEEQAQLPSMGGKQHQQRSSGSSSSSGSRNASFPMGMMMPPVVPVQDEYKYACVGYARVIMEAQSNQNNRSNNNKNSKQSLLSRIRQEKEQSHPMAVLGLPQCQFGVNVLRHNRTTPASSSPPWAALPPSAQQHAHSEEDMHKKYLQWYLNDVQRRRRQLDQDNHDDHDNDTYNAMDDALDKEEQAVMEEIFQHLQQSANQHLQDLDLDIDLDDDDDDIIMDEEQLERDIQELQKRHQQVLDADETNPKTWEKRRNMLKAGRHDSVRKRQQQQQTQDEHLHEQDDDDHNHQDAKRRLPRRRPLPKPTHQQHNDEHQHQHDDDDDEEEALSIPDLAAKCSSYAARGASATLAQMQSNLHYMTQEIHRDIPKRLYKSSNKIVNQFGWSANLFVDAVGRCKDVAGGYLEAWLEEFTGAGAGAGKKGGRNGKDEDDKW